MATSSQRRSMLLQALGYAHEAVTLDTSEDGRGAIDAYKKCTALLGDVIEAAAQLDEKSTTKQALPEICHWHRRYAQRVDRLEEKYRISTFSLEATTAEAC